MSSSFTPPEPNTGGVSSFNKVEKTISGHQFETDDTVGNERIKRSHAKGTYEEWDATGGRTLVVNGENFSAVVGNESIVISGACNVTVTGDCNLNVGAHLFAEAQTMYFQARQSINFKAGSGIHMESVNGDTTINSGGGYRITVAGEANERFQSKLDTNIVGDNDLTVGANFETQVAGISTQHSEEGANFTSAKNVKLDGGNKVIIGGGDGTEGDDEAEAGYGTGVDVYTSGAMSLNSKTATSIASDDASIGLTSKTETTIAAETSIGITSTESTTFNSEDFTIASGPVEIQESVTTRSTITGGTDVELTGHTHTQGNGNDLGGGGTTSIPE